MNATKCERCRGYFQKFHICLDNPDKKPRRVSKPHAQTMETRQKLSEIKKRWWAENQPKSEKDLDEAIIKLYSENSLGYAKVGEILGIGRNRVWKTLKRAEKEGRIKMRPRGLNVKNGAV